MLSRYTQLNNQFILSMLSIMFALFDFCVFILKNICVLFVDTLRLTMFKSQKVVPSPTPSTYFVRSLWAKSHSFNQRNRRLIPTFFNTFTSVNSSLYPLSTELTIMTTNIFNIYIIRRSV